MSLEGLFYALLAIIVLCIASMNAFIYATRTDSNFLYTVGISILTGLFLYGLILLFLKAAAKWRRAGRVLFLLMGLLGFIALPFYYYDKGGSFSDYPLLLLPYLLVVLSFVISGILIFKGKVVKTKAPDK